MFQSLSWPAYWTVVISLSALYYAILFILYFRGNVKTFLNRRWLAFSLPDSIDREFGPLQTNESSSVNSADGGGQSPALTDQNEDLIFESLIDELNAFFESMRKTKPVKEELLFALRRIIRKHTVQKDTFFGESVNNYITVQAEHICSLHLDKEDVDTVWLDR